VVELFRVVLPLVPFQVLPLLVVARVLSVPPVAVVFKPRVLPPFLPVLLVKVHHVLVMMITMLLPFPKSEDGLPLLPEHHFRVPPPLIRIPLLLSHAEVVVRESMEITHLLVVFSIIPIAVNVSNVKPFFIPPMPFSIAANFAASAARKQLRIIHSVRSVKSHCFHLTNVRQFRMVLRPFIQTVFCVLSVEILSNRGSSLNMRTVSFVIHVNRQLSFVAVLYVKKSFLGASENIAGGFGTSIIFSVVSVMRFCSVITFSCIIMIIIVRIMGRYSLKCVIIARLSFPEMNPRTFRGGIKCITVNASFVGFVVDAVIPRIQKEFTEDHIAINVSHKESQTMMQMLMGMQLMDMLTLEKDFSQDALDLVRQT
jgi:hypothetical protein